MWAYIICVNSEIEADVISGLLEEAEIPTQKKYPGDLKASYGIVNGVEVWVPNECLEQAQALLNALPQNIESSITEETGNEFDSLDMNLHKLSSNWLPRPVVISFILIICILIYWLFIGEASY